MQGYCRGENNFLYQDIVITRSWNVNGNCNKAFLLSPLFCEMYFCQILVCHHKRTLHFAKSWDLEMAYLFENLISVGFCCQQRRHLRPFYFIGNPIPVFLVKSFGKTEIRFCTIIVASSLRHTGLTQHRAWLPEKVHSVLCCPNWWVCELKLL